MYKVFRLSNGIRVVTEYIGYVKSVAAGVWVHTGSAMEEKRYNGVSHFIEHMLFKGTEKRTARDIAECMDSVGGQINAVTAKEYTCYYTKTLSEHLGIAVELLSDMLKNSTFTNENIDVERKVILEEISMCEDDPEDLIHDILSDTMWSGRPLGFPIAGTVESVSGLERGDILSYFKSNYTADNIVISVVGCFDEAMVLEALEKNFGDIERTGICSVDHPKIKTERASRIVKKDVEQCQLCLGFDGYSRQEELNYDLAVLSAVFGGNMSSRLFQKVREESGLAYSVYSYSSAYQNNGALTVYAGLNSQSLLKALEIINNEIKILKNQKLSEAEVETAKTQLKAGVVMGSEGVSSRMNAYGKSLMFDDTARTVDDLIEMIDRVSAERVAEVIDYIFDPAHMSLAVLGKTDIKGEKLLEIMSL